MKGRLELSSGYIRTTVWATRSATVGTDVSYCPSCNRELGCSGR